MKKVMNFIQKDYWFKLAMSFLVMVISYLWWENGYDFFKYLLCVSGGYFILAISFNTIAGIVNSIKDIFKNPKK